MDMSDMLSTNLWKLFPFRSGNRIWLFVLIKAYLVCIIAGFFLACMLNALEGKEWLGNSVRYGHGPRVVGDSALDECLWFVFSTMHGIGMGEYNARKAPGRIVAMLTCTIGYWFTIFLMSIIMLSQLPGEKAPTLYSTTGRLLSATWPSYTVFVTAILCMGSVIGPYISKDPYGYTAGNGIGTGIYFMWTLVHRMPYGDMWPDTVFGRFLTIPAAFVGVCYMPYALALVAVRAPTLAQHRAMLGSLRKNPQDALGRGYSEPESGSLSEFVKDGYVTNDNPRYDPEETCGCRGCFIAACFVLALIFAGFGVAGWTPHDVSVEIEEILELDLPPGLRTLEEPLPSTVWAFSFEQTLDPASAVNLGYLQDPEYGIGVDVVMVTPETLPLYNKTEEPFHRAYDYLSVNHKADYLQAYFAHNYGGAILHPLVRMQDNASWAVPVKVMQGNESYWMDAVPVPAGPNMKLACDEVNIDEVWCKEMIFADKNRDYNFSDTMLGMTSWTNSKGPCCDHVMQHFSTVFGHFPKGEGFIVRKETPFTKEWLHLLNKHLDSKLETLKLHPSPPGPCCREFTQGYPIRWSELKEEIWSPLVMKYQSHFKFNLQGLA